MSTSYLKRAQTVIIERVDGAASRTFDAPGWTLTELYAPVPPWREDYVTVPGRDGYLDLSRALTGTVVRDARTVRLTVFTVCEDHADAVGIEWKLREDYDGQRVRVKTPETIEYNSAAYYIGNCRITGTKSPFNYLYVTFEFTCEPWLYIGDGYANLSHGETSTISGTPRGSLTAANVTAINDKRANIAISYSSSTAENRETAAMSTVGLWQQRSANAFDASAHTLIDQAVPRANASATNAWQVGTAVHRSGQRIYTDELGSDWAQRIILTALNTSDAKTQTSGFKPVFPLLGNTNSVYIDVWMSGTVTTVGAAAGGKPAGISLYSGSVSGALMPTQDNWATYGTTEYGDLFVPEARTYSNEKIFHVQASSAGAGGTNPLNAIILNINWLQTGTDGLQFAFSISTSSSVSSWVQANNSRTLFQLPNTLQATGGTGWVTDAAVINAISTEFTKRTEPGWTPYRAESTGTEAVTKTATRQWFPAKTGAVTYMQAHPASSDGRACVGVLVWTLTLYNVSTATLYVGSMASDLYLQNTASPVYLKYSGTPAVIPPSGATKQLTPFTLAAGNAETVSYAIIGGAVDGETNQLTWTRGVL